MPYNSESNHAYNLKWASASCSSDVEITHWITP